MNRYSSQIAAILKGKLLVRDISALICPLVDICIENEDTQVSV